MKCYKNNFENGNNDMNKKTIHKHNPLRHMFHMIICCGLPIIIVGLLPLMSRFSPSAGTIIGKITPFLCPLMMLFMIPMMISNYKKESCSDTKKTNNEKDK